MRPASSALAPIFLLVAGPSGSGKSTLSASSIASLYPDLPIIDPNDQPLANASVAARNTLTILDRAFAAGASVGFETTLESNRGLRLLQQAGSLGYRRVLFYIGTESVEINVERIAARVTRCGRSISEADLRRQYVRSLARLPEAIGAVDEFTLFDNSLASGPMIVAHGAAGIVLHHVQTMPDWASATVL